MPTYPLFKAHVDVPVALKKIEEVLRSGYLNEGTYVAELAAMLGPKLGAENITLTNSCTSALTLALRLSGVGPGDSVVSTPMTCVASNTPIVNLGARIVWSDVDAESGMVDPSSLATALRGTGAKAALVVAWAGTPPELEELAVVARTAGAKLVLDAAHAFGATYKGRPVHRWADYTCYSFQAIKHFTTGDGGALVCDSWRDHSRANALKWFGLDRDRAKDAQGNWRGQQWDVDVVDAGHKFNMNNLAAAVGISQVAHIDELLDAHRRHAALYDELFSDIEAFVPAKRPAESESSSWVYTIVLDPLRTQCSRDRLLESLNAEGIAAGVVHVRNDAYTCFKGFRLRSLPGLSKFAANQLSLPCGWWLTDDDVRHIAARVKELVR